MRPLTILVGIVLAFAAPAAAAEPGDEIGPEVLLETSGASPAIATNAAGEIGLAWNLFGGPTPDVMLRWYDATAQPLTAPIRVNQADTRAWAPDLAVNPAGVAAVAWEREFDDNQELSSHRYQTYFRAYDANKQPLSPPQPTTPVIGEFEGVKLQRGELCDDSGEDCPFLPSSTRGAAVALNESDGVFVAWERILAPEQSRVVYNRFFASGLPGGLEMQAGTSLPIPSLDPSQAQREPRADIAYARGMNAFGVTWSVLPGPFADGEEGARFRVFDHLGLPRSAEIDLSFPGHISLSPKVATDPKGFVVAWTAFDYQPEPDVALVVARRFRPDGTPRGRAFAVTAPEVSIYGGILEELAVDAAGNLAVLFRGPWQPFPHARELYLKLVDRKSAPASGEIQVTTPDPQFPFVQSGGALTAAPGGDFLVVWTNLAGINLQRFAGVGSN